jgi:hypothetical protein
VRIRPTGLLTAARREEGRANGVEMVTNDASWRPRLREGWPDVTVVTFSELAELAAG